jgi:bidirectional [NiFe] hydrogenase diaphorase subunit
MTPSQVIDEITRSGLRGRGGAGYPTGVKWSLVAKMPDEHKFVICNADEGDPGAFMDRSVLESDPHRVLEGMTIAAYALGASQAYIYVRGEYPLAIHRLDMAIKQARKLGVLGSQIFESPFNLRIDLRIGAGAFVCGEETALIASVEGKRGTPRSRPPYPAEKGLWDAPTLINNVETVANVPPLITRGADWFAGIGTAKSKGTKVFALAGKIRYTGLVEVPMGMSLRTIVEDLGGGAPDGGAIKAVQTGGPSGVCIPANLLDTPVDYESLQQLGSIMGSGGMIFMDQTTNMVEVARFFMEFCMDDGRVVRQVHPLPRRHRADAPPAVAHRRWPGRRQGRAHAGNAVRHGQAHEPVRPRPVGPQPRPQHAALLSARVRQPAQQGRPRAASPSVAPGVRGPLYVREDADHRRQAHHLAP